MKNVSCLEKCPFCVVERCCRNCANLDYTENSPSNVKFVCTVEEAMKGKVGTQPKTAPRRQSFIMEGCQKWHHYRPNNVKPPEPVVDTRYNPFKTG